MTHMIDRDALRRHQEAALGVLARGAACIADGQEAVLANKPQLRREMADVLDAYQRFKHDRIFDPAIRSGDEQRAALARHMKVGCIAAGEVFRAHGRQWKADAIVADWPRYKASARLTVNQLRRHIVTESEGIAELIDVYGEA